VTVPQASGDALAGNELDVAMLEWLESLGESVGSMDKLADGAVNVLVPLRDRAAARLEKVTPEGPAARAISGVLVDCDVAIALFRGARFDLTLAFTHARQAAHAALQRAPLGGDGPTQPGLPS
jgi:hypothetical protein